MVMALFVAFFFGASFLFPFTVKFLLGLAYRNITDFM